HSSTTTSSSNTRPDVRPEKSLPPMASTCCTPTSSKRFATRWGAPSRPLLPPRPLRSWNRVPTRRSRATLWCTSGPIPMCWGIAWPQARTIVRSTRTPPARCTSSSRRATRATESSRRSFSTRPRTPKMWSLRLRRHLHNREVELGTRRETQFLVERDRVLVLGCDVQHRRIAACFDLEGNRAHEPCGQTPVAVLGVGAHRADLGVALPLTANPAHRNEAAGIVAHAEVRAHLDGASEERARLGALDERKHVGRILGAESRERGVGLAQRSGRDHLQSRQCEQQRQIGGR